MVLLSRRIICSISSATLLRYDTAGKRNLYPFLADIIAPRVFLFAKGVNNIAFL